MVIHELATIRAWKRGSASTSISINCLGALGLSYCGYTKRSVLGAICPDIFSLSSIIIIIILLRNYKSTSNCVY